jgi:hypothetical protein
MKALGLIAIIAIIVACCGCGGNEHRPKRIRLDIPYGQSSSPSIGQEAGTGV